METISLLITGGTIDKVYDKINGSLSFSKSNIPAILNTSRINTQIDITELMLVDSLDMTHEQRTEIVDACKNTQHSKIIITHGTDTMAETAKEIAKENFHKTIVLTGAMIPYTLLNSDSTFNIASSIAYVQTLKPGIYIVMNGQYFNWDNVKKNKKLGVFQTL